MVDIQVDIHVDGVSTSTQARARDGDGALGVPGRWATWRCKVWPPPRRARRRWPVRHRRGPPPLPACPPGCPLPRRHPAGKTPASSGAFCLPQARVRHLHGQLPCEIQAAFQWAPAGNNTDGIARGASRVDVWLSRKPCDATSRMFTGGPFVRADRPGSEQPP